MRQVIALSLVGTACAVVGGVIYWAAHGDTTITRSTAFGCWIAAAVALVLALVSGRKLVWRYTSLPVLEGWVFYSAAFALTAVGVVIDAIGS